MKINSLPKSSCKRVTLLQKHCCGRCFPRFFFCLRLHKTSVVETFFASKKEKIFLIFSFGRPRNILGTGKQRFRNSFLVCRGLNTLSLTPGNSFFFGNLYSRLFHPHCPYVIPDCSFVKFSVHEGTCPFNQYQRLRPFV